MVRYPEKIIRENQLDIKIYNAENLQISTIPNVYEVKAKDCDLAYLIYTSGTSGIPKGVEVEHCQLFQLLEWCNSETLAMGCASTLQFSPLSFDPSLLEIFTTLLNGKKLFMLDSNQRKDITFLLAFIISNNKLTSTSLLSSSLSFVADNTYFINIFTASITCSFLQPIWNRIADKHWSMNLLSNNFYFVFLFNTIE